jgi:hypothetical protein
MRKPTGFAADCEAMRQRAPSPVVMVTERAIAPRRFLEFGQPHRLLVALRSFERLFLNFTCHFQKTISVVQKRISAASYRRPPGTSAKHLKVACTLGPSNTAARGQEETTYTEVRDWVSQTVRPPARGSFTACSITSNPDLAIRASYSVTSKLA